MCLADVWNRCNESAELETYVEKKVCLIGMTGAG